MSNATVETGKLAFKAAAKINARNEIAGFMGAEFLGGLTTVGAMYLLQKVPQSVMDPLSCTLGKVLEPVQPIVEKAISTVCQLDECKPDPTKPVEQRAKEFARILLISLPAVAASWFVKYGSRRKFNDWMKVPNDSHNTPWWKVWKMSPEEKMLFLADEGMHTFAMGAVQYGPLAPCTDTFIHHTKEAMKQHLGWSEEGSHEVATMIALHEIPNAIAAVTAGGVIAGRHLRGWPTGWVGKVLGKKTDTVSAVLGA